MKRYYLCMTEAQDKINLLSMSSADVQLVGGIRLQNHVPRAGSFEVCPGIIYS